MISRIEWVQWVIGIGLVAVLIALVFVAWWGLFADRPRGRRRCPRCWYDLSFTDGMKCTECGYEGRTEKSFARTRRKPALALLAILGGSVIGGFAIDRAKLQGWMTYVPTTVLAWSLPVASGPDGALAVELERRWRRRGLSRARQMSLLERCVAGNVGMRPPDEDWNEKYGALTRRWSSMLLQNASPEERSGIQELLLTLPPVVTISSPRTWPTDVAPTLDVSVQEWWPAEAQLRVTATPDLPGAAPDVHFRRRERFRQQHRSYSLTLPPLDEGTHDVDIALAFERRMGEDEPWEPFGRHEVTVTVDTAGTLADTLTPVHDAEIDEIMTRLVPGLVKYGSGSLPVRVDVRARRTYVAACDDLVFGVRVDVMRNGVTARQLDIWWAGGTQTVTRRYSFEVPMLDDELLGAPDRPDDEWTVRVRGMPEIALRVTGVSRYWAGDVIYPVPLRHLGGASPTRGWIPPALDTEQARRAAPGG